MFDVQFFWHFSKVDWIKINNDIGTRDVLSFTICGGIFRSNFSDYVGSFYTFLGIQHIFMLKSWKSFLLLNMLNLRFSKKFSWSVTCFCFVKLLFHCIISLKIDDLSVNIFVPL